MLLMPIVKKIELCGVKKLSDNYDIHIYKHLEACVIRIANIIARVHIKYHNHVMRGYKPKPSR